MKRARCTVCPTSGYVKPASPHGGYGYGGAIYPNSDQRGLSASDAFAQLVGMTPTIGNPQPR